MKKIIIFLSPLLASLSALLLPLPAAWFVSSDSGYGGLGLGVAIILSVLFIFPIWFSWYTGKHTKFILLPSLYSTIICALPWIGTFIEVFRGGISYHERIYVDILVKLFVWTFICFLVMRLYRHFKPRRRYDNKHKL